MKTIFVIKSGDLYRSFVNRLEWSEDINCAEIYRSKSGATSSLKIAKDYLEKKLERIQQLIDAKTKSIYENLSYEELNESYTKDYMLFVEAKIVEVNIVPAEKK